MNLPEKLSKHFDIQRSLTQQIKPKTKWTSANGILRLALMLAVSGAIVCAPLGKQVLAKSGQQTEVKTDKNDAADIDPDAIEALNKMGVYLRTLKSFQVTDDVTHDDVLDDGLIVQTNSKIDLLAARPDRLRVEVTADDKHRLYLYDGKNFTVWGRLNNYYATVPAPPTIGELFEKVDEKYDIQLPLYDLFNWGTSDEAAKRIKTAIDIGPSVVDGVTCEHYAFHQEGVDWQIWIQLGEFPLPRKLVITTLDDEAKPQHSDTLAWNLAPSFNDGAFVFDPPPDAKRIIITEQKPDATENGK